MFRINATAFARPITTKRNNVDWSDFSSLCDVTIFENKTSQLNSSLRLPIQLILRQHGVTFYWVRALNRNSVYN